MTGEATVSVLEVLADEAVVVEVRERSLDISSASICSGE
jgi:hypothetical protein